MAKNRDSDYQNYDPTKPPPEMKLYNENTTNSQRFKSLYDSTKIGEDGKFLGVPFSPQMAGTFRFLLNQAIPEIADYAGDHSTRVGQNFLRNFVSKDPEFVLKNGEKLGKGLAYSLVMMQPIAETAGIAYNTSSRLTELRSALSTVMKANGKTATVEGIFSDNNNEVIHNARQKIFKGVVNDLVGTAAGTIAVIPGLMTLNKKYSKELSKEASEAKLEYLKEHGTPEQMKEYYLERVKGTSVGTGDMRSVMREVRDDAKKDYIAEYKKFSKDRKNIKKADKVIDKAGKDPEALLDLLGDLGVERNSALKRRAEKIVNASNGTEGALKGAKEKFSLSADEKNALRAKKLKNDFSNDHDPWDAAWVTPDQQRVAGRRNSVETIRGTIEQDFKKEMDRINGVDVKNKGKDGVTEKTMNHVTQALFGLGAETLRGFAGKETTKKLKDKLALDMIIGMRKSIDENPERETIPGASEKNQEEEYSYGLYVHRIFQEQQHDSGLAEIGDRYTKSMKAVNWDDKQIQSMKDSDLNEYEVAIKHISQYIREGRMDPLALINLVGERKIVQKSGKSFGVLNSEDKEAKKENIVEEIDKQAALIRPHHKMDDDEVSQAMANYTFTKEELQAAFSNHGLDADAKAFLFALLDTNTPDDKVLKDLTGRSEGEIKQLRLDSQKHFSNQLDAALREISEDLENNPAALERYNLSEDEGKAFQRVYQEAQQTGASIGDVLGKENRKMVDSSVANILVDDSLKHAGRFWRDRVKPHAEKTMVQNKEEGRAKEEQRQFAQDSLDADERSGFANRVSAGRSQRDNDDYLDNMPYVSKDMQDNFDGLTMKSYANQQQSGQNYSVTA